MTERWERRLQVLHEVGAPASISAGVADGPRGTGDPGPSPVRRVVTIVVAFAVFAAAGTFAWRALRPGATPDIAVGTDGPTVVATFLVGDLNGVGPSGTLTAVGRSIEGAIGSYCWTFPGGSGCGDAVAPSFTEKDFLTVEQGSTLIVQGDADSVDGELDLAGTFPFERVVNIGALNEPLLLDEAPGDYVLAFVAHADQGDVPFYFPVRLVAPSSVGDPPAELPVLSASFTRAGAIDEDMVRVDTLITYGDAREEDFTSTTPDGAMVDWVGVESLPALALDPAAGSAVSITADGEDPRVLIGSPDAWPTFERFQRIDRLPSIPGDYVLVFQADYPEGTATTARRVHIVAPETLALGAGG